MMHSTTAADTAKKPDVRLWAAGLWLLVWQAGSLLLGQEILLASPVTVLLRLSQLVFQAGFWGAVFFSFLRIVSGFLTAVAAAVLCAAAASRFPRLRELLAPPIAVLKATPVASFIILVLIWVPSRSLSVVISFMMVMPILYLNLLEGITSTDRQLLEMASLFQVSGLKQVRYIYLSQVMPFFRSACSVSLGLCWKSGIAAEVIGIPDGSIGERLYQAKIFLDTPDLFAWTVVIILVSLLFEKLFLAAIDAAVNRIERL